MLVFNRILFFLPLIIENKSLGRKIARLKQFLYNMEFKIKNSFPKF